MGESSGFAGEEYAKRLKFGDKIYIALQVIKSRVPQLKFYCYLNSISAAWPWRNKMFCHVKIKHIKFHSLDLEAIPHEWLWDHKNGTLQFLPFSPPSVHCMLFQRSATIFCDWAAAFQQVYEAIWIGLGYGKTLLLKCDTICRSLQVI